MYLFNNCHNRRHAAMYGSGAFYDLNTTGFQATLANNLPVGETCVIASRHPMGITFDWYKFSRERVKADDTGTPCRAFFGERVKTETLSRADAKRNGIYSRFFDINGNFKRRSVLRCNFYVARPFRGRTDESICRTTERSQNLRPICGQN